jgi:hypothetical protein
MVSLLARCGCIRAVMTAAIALPSRLDIDVLLSRKLCRVHRDR